MECRANMPDNAVVAMYKSLTISEGFIFPDYAKRFSWLTLIIQPLFFGPENVVCIYVCCIYSSALQIRCFHRSKQYEP